LGIKWADQYKCMYMFSNDDFQTPQGKARKGLAAVSIANGCLRIRIGVGADRQVMSLGLPDTPVNRKHAEEKAHRINLDIITATLIQLWPSTSLRVC
jgi:hypothetical protein